MKHKENIEKSVKQETVVSRKEILKQLGIFLGICLPVTWLLMGIGYQGVSEDGSMAPWANLLITLACFMPAIAAIVTSLITKEKLKELQFMPRFKGNGKVYLLAIVLGIVLSLTDVLLMAVFFPDKARFSEEATVAIVIFTLLIMLAMSLLQFWVGMGEELGWMGYLFPRLEKLCGTTIALIATGVIRGFWHLVMFLQGENFLVGLLSLCVSNILLGSVLVWATKAGRSVIPASIIHVMTNALPGALAAYMIMDESLYDSGFSGMDVFSMLPALIMGIVCYIILIKKYKVEKL
ncbi:MAG: CPBP family intramembrane metalloprotease [Lachnospiraceae bacterium]|nr:CPBP family intramembrane metalloprotease [Lachnospiraceae bacterium]